MFLLRPLSWLYGAVMAARNWCFDHDVLLHAEKFDVPTIAVGNLAVGGTGKTPHAEYLLRQLAPRWQTAFLSRGYGRETHGYVGIDDTKSAAEVGDEPLQVHRKFPTVRAAVCEDRREGLRRLLAETPRPEVVVLDDAFQHRYVQAGLYLLLTDYHRLYCADHVLPEGRLRERPQGARRAHVILVTKCPAALSANEMAAIRARLAPLPSQALFFTTFAYGQPYALFPDESQALPPLEGRAVLTLTGIAHPESLYHHVEQAGGTVHALRFADHHSFSAQDLDRINRAFAALPDDALVLTTEKDAARLRQVPTGLSEALRRRLFVQPVEVRFLEDETLSLAARAPRNNRENRDSREGREKENRPLLPLTAEQRFNQIITDYVTDLSTDHKGNS